MSGLLADWSSRCRSLNALNLSCTVSNASNNVLLALSIVGMRLRKGGRFASASAPIILEERKLLSSFNGPVGRSFTNYFSSSLGTSSPH